MTTQDVTRSERLTRQDILKYAGGAAAAASASDALAQRAEGQPLLGNPHSSRMTAFVSDNTEKARMLEERYGVRRFYGYSDHDDIAGDDEIDCIYIVLPVGLHTEYTIRALEAGKRVLCKKPARSVKP